MRGRTSLAVALLAVVPAIVAAQGRGHGGPPPRPHGGGPLAHARGKAGTPHGNSQGKAHGKTADAGKAHGRQNATARLADKPQLRAALEQRLPAGTNLDAAAEGFDSLGRFIAAVNVSKNLEIPFDQLKARTTGDSAVPLGKAIQELRPAVNGDSEAKRAEREARDLMSGRK
jgi:hypothetical protein